MSPPLLGQPFRSHLDPDAPDGAALVSWWHEYDALDHGNLWASKTLGGGSSGSRTLSPVSFPLTIPPGVSTVNGHPVAVCGTDSELKLLYNAFDDPAPLRTIIPGDEFTMIVAATIGMSGATDPYLFMSAIGGSDTGTAPGGLYLQLDTAPSATIGAKDSVYRTASRSFTLSQWTAFFARAKDGILGLRVNGGAWATTSFAGFASGSLDGGFRLGTNADKTDNLQYSLGDFLIVGRAFSDYTIDAWLAYFRTKYAQPFA